MIPIETFMPTDAGEAAFIEWLEAVLRHPENAAEHAGQLIGAHDWSAGQTIEVPSFYTKSGNPAIYTFAATDLHPQAEG